MGRPRKIENEQLLAHARAVFVDQGIGASTREIAQRAGVSEAILYQRFSTKADLFFAAMVPPALDVEALLTTDSNQVDPQEHLEEIGLGLLAYFRELVPILIPLLSHPSFDLERAILQHPDSAMGRIRTGLSAYMAQQKDQERLHCDDPALAALTLFSSIHSLALFERMGAHGGNFDDSAVRGVIRCLWTGIG